MSDRNVSLLASLRREEYTGENRCIPCTVTNVGIASVVAVLVGLVAIDLAVVVFGASLLTIYLRGYLVPGTPTLTKRYFPNRVLELFDKHPHEDSADEQEWETLQKLEEYERNAVEPEEFLRDIDAIEPCEREAGVCYTAAFEGRIQAELDTLAVEQPNSGSVTRGDGSGIEMFGEAFEIDVETLGEMYDVDPATISFEDREYPAVKTGRRIRKWPTEESLALDVATHRALDELSSRWREVPQKQRADILRELRVLAQSCPNCGGQVAASDAIVESCCAQYEVVSIGCEDCGAHLLERDPEKREGSVGGFDP